MKQLSITTSDLDKKQRAFESLARDWVDRECKSFDAAVREAAGAPAPGGASIWDVPAIDSKAVVGLLVELEPLLGCRIPCQVIRRGGYADADQLVERLFAKVREACKGGGASGKSQTGGSTSTTPPAQV